MRPLSSALNALQKPSRREPSFEGMVPRPLSPIFGSDDGHDAAQVAIQLLSARGSSSDYPSNRRESTFNLDDDPFSRLSSDMSWMATEAPPKIVSVPTIPDPPVPSPVLAPSRRNVPSKKTSSQYENGRKPKASSESLGARQYVPSSTSRYNIENQPPAPGNPRYKGKAPMSISASHSSLSGSLPLPSPPIMAQPPAQGNPRYKSKVPMPISASHSSLSGGLPLPSPPIMAQPPAQGNPRYRSKAPMPISASHSSLSGSLPLPGPSILAQRSPLPKASTPHSLISILAPSSPRPVHRGSQRIRISDARGLHDNPAPHIRRVRATSTPHSMPGIQQSPSIRFAVAFAGFFSSEDGPEADRRNASKRRFKMKAKREKEIVKEEKERRSHERSESLGASSWKRFNRSSFSLSSFTSHSSARRSASSSSQAQNRPDSPWPSMPMPWARSRSNDHSSARSTASSDSSDYVLDMDIDDYEIDPYYVSEELRQTNVSRQASISSALSRRASFVSRRASTIASKASAIFERVIGSENASSSASTRPPSVASSRVSLASNETVVPSRKVSRDYERRTSVASTSASTY